METKQFKTSEERDTALQKLSDYDMLRLLFVKIQGVMEDYDVDFDDMLEDDADKLGAVLRECRRRLYEVPAREILQARERGEG